MSALRDAFPDAEVTTLTQLQHSDDRKGPWKLYIYEQNSGYHRGGVWFMEKPKYPEEGEITITVALNRVMNAEAELREVRICDVGDMLVYHSKDGRVLHGANFFNEIGVLKS